MIDISYATSSSVDYSITAKPNCALSRLSTLYIFVIIAVLCLIFSLSFVLIGAWPVFLFTGLELVVLAACFCNIWKHDGDFERLTIGGGKVIIDTHELGCDKHIELSSYWARIVLNCMSEGGCRKLALRSHGREIEFGRHMSSEERLNLAIQLKSRLGSFPK